MRSISFDWGSLDTYNTLTITLSNGSTNVVVSRTRATATKASRRHQRPLLRRHRRREQHQERDLRLEPKTRSKSTP